VHRVALWLSLFVFLFLLPIYYAFAQGTRVVISEVMWAGSDLSTADEWVELMGISQDPGSSPLSLAGWTLRYRNSGGDEVTIYAFLSETIGSGQILLLSNYDEPNSRLAVTPDIVTTSMVLPNSKLLLYLRTSTGMIVDQVDDYVGAPFAGSNQSPKASMERVDLFGSGAIKSNWQTASTFRGFDDGADLRGTPGFPNRTGPSTDTVPPRDATTVFAYTTSGSLNATWIPSISLDLLDQILLFDPSFEDGTSTVTLSSTETGFLTTSVQEGVTYSLTHQSRDTAENTSTGVTVTVASFPEVKITEVLSNPIGSDDEEWIEVGNLGSTSVDIAGWILDEGNSPDSFTIPQMRTETNAFPPKSLSDFSLAPNEHVSFRKSVSNLPLGNQGESLSLTWGSLLIDSWTYRETAEEVSFGREEGNPNHFRSFCVPTEGKPNRVLPLDPKIEIQSPDGYPVGTEEVSDEEKVSINVRAVVFSGSLASASCAWTYSDGYTSESCNPPSHTFDSIGSHRIDLSVQSFCGNTSKRVLTVVVLAGGVSQDRVAESSTDAGGTQGGRGGGGGGGGRRGVTRFDACVPSDGVAISIWEFLPDPIGSDQEGEWIELRNDGSLSVSLCGFSLDDSDGGTRPFSLDAFEIPGNGFLLLTKKQSKIALNNGGDSVRILKDGDVLQEVLYEKAREGESFAQMSDGSFVWTSNLSPGEENVFGDQGAVFSEGAPGPMRQRVIISELYPAPNKGEEEWIELWNPTDVEMDLRGWVLDDLRDGGSRPWVISGSTILSALGYLSFSHKETGLWLNNEGDEVWLHSADGRMIDHVTYPRMKKGTSYSRVFSPYRIIERFCISKDPTREKRNSCPRVSLVGSQIERVEYPQRLALNQKESIKKVFNKKESSRQRHALFPGMRVRFKAVVSEGEEREEPRKVSAVYQRLSAQVVTIGSKEREKGPEGKAEQWESLFVSLASIGGLYLLSIFRLRTLS